MQVPKLEKITVNMGVGEAMADQEGDGARAVRSHPISGQKPVVTLARKSVASFKIREGYPSAARSRCGASACTSSSTG
jgi:large subunit ribosomal protein L5